MIKVRKIAERIKVPVVRGRDAVLPKRPGELCRERARAWVHAYAIGGAAYAFVPIPVPGSTTAGLVALETTMIHAIGRIYGVDLAVKDAAAIVTGLEVAGGALKTVARELAVLVPGVGWVARGVVAAGSIEAIGNAVIQLFEKRYPDRVCVN